jgi:hypothetical protein
LRAHEVKNYDSVLQLLSEPGCPICAFLKNVQAKLVQEGDVAEVVRLCNAHAWAIAAVRETETAAQVFLSLLETCSTYASHECSICLRLDQEEILRTQELIAALDRRSVLEWIKKHGVLCVPHGLRIRTEAPVPAQKLIDQILERRAGQLETALRLLLNSSRSDSQHGGLLGRVAEYLVAQRGIALGHMAHSMEDVKS